MFCFVVAICDLVHDEGGYKWPLLAANSIWKAFLKYVSNVSDASHTAIRSFIGITHISVQIFRQGGKI